MFKKIKFLKTILLTILGLTIFTLSPVILSTNSNTSHARTATERANRLKVEPYTQCNNNVVNEGEYEQMKAIIGDETKAISNYITFLDEPLSSKNNVFIKQTCKPRTFRNNSGQSFTRYDNCESQVTCVCNPQFPNLNSSREDEKSSINCRRVQFIVYKTGQELASKYVNLVYRWVSSIVGIVAVIYIIVNGIIISAAQNDSGQVTAAKDRIMQSLIALVVLLCASLILYAINPTFFTRDVVPTTEETSSR